MTAALHWSPKLGTLDETVEGLEDIAQAIRIILETPKGSDPLRPLFGSDLWKYIDRPLPAVVPILIRESWDAIRAWEPRALVEKVRVIPAAGRAAIEVQWRPVGGVLTEVTRVG